MLALAVLFSQTMKQDMCDMSPTLHLYLEHTEHPLAVSYPNDGQMQLLLKSLHHALSFLNTCQMNSVSVAVNAQQS